jgi:hypothetical protein
MRRVNVIRQHAVRAVERSGLLDRELVPTRGGALLPRKGARQFERALEQIEQRASIVEAAAERDMRMKALLNDTAKMHVAVAVVHSRQLKEIAPEAGEVFDTFDTGFAMDLRATIQGAG